MHQSAHPHDEKQGAAINSVIAAVALTGTKIAVGLLTGSLGILAEAAHSGLDLVAALMTWMAVRISDRPADQTHPYGHGKVENLSALFETALLVATCVWIIWEAVHRLAHAWEFKVEVTAWSFIVIIFSIVIDVSRSRMLFRAARKFNSQALEADALHFQTDIWSSAVVLLGLVGVLASRIPGAAFLLHADAVAALVVAAIVVWVSFRMGFRTVQALLDAAPEGMTQKIKNAAESLPGVMDCHRIRVRYSGPRLFVDAHFTTDGGQTLREAHDLANRVEQTIQDIAPDADVTVHPEPPEDHRSPETPTTPEAPDERP
ncbi:MAG: cation transporter [Acidobacteria bacterium]|nr:cation transporter [Acidobacteriota bacterium]